MAARPRVLARMAVRRAVAAQRPPAFLAGAQVHPCSADLYAFLAFSMLRVLDLRIHRDMPARRFRHRLFSYSWSTLWTKATAIDPSPTADATRLMLPPRTSPTANTPGRLVSRR